MNHQEWTDEVLLSAYATHLDNIRNAQAQSGRIQQELIRRMSLRQATSIPSERFICELIVDRARIPGAPSLSFKARESAHASALGGLMVDQEADIRHIRP